MAAKSMAAKSDGRREAAQHESNVEGWLSTRSSANTRAAYRSDLAAFGRWCSGQGLVPLTVDTEALVAFQAARELAGDSDSTMRRRWSALSSFYEFAVDRQLASVNPTVGADRPKVGVGDPGPTVTLSPEAVASYRALATALDPRLDALVALLVSDGLKMGEALAVDIGDISRTQRTMTVTVRRRGERTRVVLDRDTVRAVRRCIGDRRCGPLFLSERASATGDPHRLTRFGADHLIRQLRTQGAHDGVTANALRRYHITTRRDRGSEKPVAAPAPRPRRSSASQRSEPREET